MIQRNNVYEKFALSKIKTNKCIKPKWHEFESPFVQDKGIRQYVVLFKKSL